MLAILIEGVFERQDDGTWKSRNPVSGEQQDILGTLAPLVGQRAQLAIHHLPFAPTPPDPTKWINVNGDGTLSIEEGVLKLTQFNGDSVSARLQDFSGCYARIVAANLDAINRMRDIVEQAGVGGMIDDLSEQVNGLQEVVNKIAPGEDS